MRTNLEKWNYYHAIVKQREEDYIKKNVDEIPEYVYSIYPTGKIRKLQITYISYSNRLYFSGKKPTRDDVKKINDYVTNNAQMTLDKVHVGWKSVGDKYNSSSAFKYTERDQYLTLEEVKIKSREAIEKKENEERLLENGHIRCAYCNKVVPEKDSISHTIIFQNSRQDPYSRTGWKKFVDRKTNKYCSGKCGGNDQMAHEG
jgi:hypothetical protein